MDLVVLTLLGVLLLLVRIALALVARDIYACLPRLQICLIRIAANRLPEDLRERAYEEWLRDMQDLWPSELRRLLFAVGCLYSASIVILEHRRRVLGATGLRVLRSSLAIILTFEVVRSELFVGVAISALLIYAATVTELTGLVIVAVGFACIGIDRWASHVFFDHLGDRFHSVASVVSGWTSQQLWRIVIPSLFAVSWIISLVPVQQPISLLCAQVAKAAFESVMIGGTLLGVLRLIIGRRRPRDDLEMGLYGYMPFRLDSDYNSFPSNHALTIATFATIASALWPGFFVIWLVTAVALTLVRPLISTNYISDALVGGGIQTVITHEVLVNFFPSLGSPAI